MQTAGGRRTVCGVLVNVHPNLPRDEYDSLKAILHNAATHGAASQSRTGIPTSKPTCGRISWVEQVNPERGRKLRELPAEIDWG